MANARKHYSPPISRLLVCALYHEARKRKQPMTRLLDELLATSLSGRESMKIAEAQQARMAETPIP